MVIDYNISDEYLLFLNNMKKRHNNFKIYKNNKNYGISISKNNCIKILENFNKKYFCLLDDDVFIKKDFLLYLNNLFINYNLPFFSNSNYKFNNDNYLNIEKYLLSKLPYYTDTDTHDYFGNLLIINKVFLEKHGYFYIFKSKIGVEHIEITRRYLSNSKFDGYGIDLKDFICNNEIINGKDTLFLHSKNVNDDEYNLNCLELNELKNDYVSYNMNNYKELILNNETAILVEQNKLFFLKNKEIQNIPHKNNNIITDKINFIDFICWINLDRSKERSIYMKDILKDINIPNYRIKAIDGINLQFNTDNLNKGRELKNNEIACTLSHIKAINFLKNISGNYFMICEDDISLHHVYLFKNNLKTIITDCPKFDILLIYKTYFKEIKNTYEKWVDHEIHEPCYDHICGTVCYIISKEGLNKINSKNKYISDDIFEISSDVLFDVADIFLYKNLNTYVYKYNFISTRDEESSIHEGHLDYHKKSNTYQLNNLLTNINNF